MAGAVQAVAFTQPSACRSPAGALSRRRPSLQLEPLRALHPTSCSGHGSSSASGSSSSTSSRQPLALVKPAGTVSNILELNEFRRGVGLCIFRDDGLVFAARRVDDPLQSWQMPQGGIDPLENPMRACLRELHEETAMTSVHIVASIDSWLTYDFPTSVRHATNSSILKYRGQTQKWFLLHFHGDDSEINLEACIGYPNGHGHHTHAEFTEWAWRPLESLPGGVVPFKKCVYAQVARHFGPEIQRRLAAGTPLA